MKLLLNPYMKSMPEHIYADKVVDAPRPDIGDRWPIDGIEPGPGVIHVGTGYEPPIVVKLYSELTDAELHRALDREGDWSRHGRDIT